MPPDLLDLLACPGCRAHLTSEGQDALRCDRCGARYPVRDGIPILLPPGFDATHVHDELAHHHKQEQARYYDAAGAEEFETTRPHGAPDLYRWLLHRKFRRGVERLPALSGATFLVACCGSGMDAEMLSRAGARVIALDISEGCVRRARDRARRFALDYLPVVGDVECLPLGDRSVDVSFVHDGLHHLDDPALGLRDLARVARRAVSINEPADALATAAAVRMGIALAREDAGNRVARLRESDVNQQLAALGFDPRASRYLMYYRHRPGAMMRVASRPPLSPFARAGVVLADAAIGRWGNKLQVTALRRAA
jgi:ubiquinone/menaquinone biosynthesis C-methylase UbiE/uncharacterized protein YbaR (Trm112 family)